MDTVFGIKGKDFVMLVADAYTNVSLIRLVSSSDKIKVIGEDKLMAFAGETADCDQFGNNINRNIHLIQIRQGHNLAVDATANFTRTSLAQALRENPFFVNLLVAGMDLDSNPKLYWLDYLASMVELTKGAHGYGSYLIMSILDKYYVPDLTRDQAIEISNLCIMELKKRFILGPTNFVAKIVSKDGIQTDIQLKNPEILKTTSSA